MDTIQGGHLIKDGDMSASITGKSMNIEGATVVGVQLTSASATHVGTVAIQMSNDGTNWTTVESFTVAASTVLDQWFDLVEVGGRSLRAIYTRTSGNGTLNVTACRKE